MGGHWLVLNVGGTSWELQWLLDHAQFLLVPPLGEVITVEDHAVTSVDLDGLAAADVCGHVVLLLAK